MAHLRLGVGALAVAWVAAIGGGADAQAKKDPKDELAARWSAAAKRLSQRHAELAKKLVAKKMHELAWEEWLHAAELDPSNVEAERALGRTFDKSKSAWVAAAAAKPKKNEGTPSELKIRAKECADERLAASAKLIDEIEMLARWAESQGLKEPAKDLWRRILRDYDSRHEPALLATGSQFIDGRWVMPDDVARHAEGKKRIDDSAEGDAVSEASELDKKLEWKLVKRRSAHFLLEGMHSDDEMKELVRCCEAAHAQVCEALRLDAGAVSARIHGVFMAEAHHFDVFIDRAVDLRENDRARYKSLGGYASSAKLLIANYQGENSWADVKDISVHMTAHLLLDQTLKTKPAPAWLREGLAFWCTERLLVSAFTECQRNKTGASDERGLPDVRDWPKEVREAAVHGTAPPLRAVMLSDLGSLTPPAMMKAWSLVDYLLTDQREKFTAFLGALKSGKEQEEALKEAFGGPGIEEVDALWVASVKAKS